MDREEFSCEEYATVKEHQIFTAEEYRGKEILNNSLENFSCPETSALSSSSKTTTNSNSKQDIDNINNSQSSSSTPSATDPVTSTGSSASSASTTATSTVSATATSTTAVATSTGVIAGIATVGAVVTLGIVPIGATETPVNYGTLTQSYCYVDYYYDDNGEIVSDITLSFNGNLLDGYTCKAVDVSTGAEVGLEGNEIYFYGLERGDKEFDIKIFKDENEVSSFNVAVPDNYVYEETHNVSYSYKTTYNEDGTSNLYVDFSTDYEGQFTTALNLYGEYSALDYQTQTTESGQYCIFGITEAFYEAEFETYFVKNDVYYSYFKQEAVAIDNSYLSWSASVVDDELRFDIDNEIDGEIEIEVTHDDLSVETFTLTESDWTEKGYSVMLNQISFNPVVKITVNSLLSSFDEQNLITDFIGSEYRTISDTKTLNAFVTTKVSLSKIEIYNASYNDDYTEGVTKVRLFLDGYTNQGDSISVKVFNSDGEQVTSAENLTGDDLAKPVTFKGLTEGADYTFGLYTVIDGNESETSSIAKTLSTPSEYSSLDLFINTPNPGDAMVTYNDDGTTNVYIYVNPKPTEGYDRYYTVTLRLIGHDNDGNTTYTDYECTGTEAVAKFENLPAGSYIVNYAEFVNVDGTCYVTSDLVYPSGSIVTSLTADGYYSEYCGHALLDETTNTLTIGISGKLTSDISINLTINGENISFTLTPVQAEPSEGSGWYYNETIDLSQYVTDTITSYSGTITGEAELGCTGTTYVDGSGFVLTRTLITQATEVKGNQSCLYKFETTNIAS
ncbi:MAG: hypothetical protein ACI4MS_00220 [Candidatus Coproplasma sp.]